MVPTERWRRMPRPRASARPGFWGALLAALVLCGAVILAVRFRYGLGAVTNLSDRWPWGLWVGFDILCGVGLAAGGFVITTVVYVFNLKRYQPIVRPTIVTAFLGYLLVVVALLFDLGRPWNIWHPLVMWNPHSVMFEVSWCVTLYTTVLLLEFSGLVFERLGFSRALVLQHAATLPLVVAGALLSTLHQSSLGSFYLIVPHKLHALWYTPWLPVMFWTSAVCAGLAMAIVEARLSSRALGHRLELPLLTQLGRVLAGALFVYAAVRLYDLAARGVLSRAWDGSRESFFFALEFGPGVLLPLVLLVFPRVHRSAAGLHAAGLMVVVGFVVNRLNVSLTGFEASAGATYTPAFSEVVVTLLLVALGFAAFGRIARALPVYAAAESPAPAPGRLREAA